MNPYLVNAALGFGVTFCALSIPAAAYLAWALITGIRGAHR